MYVAKLFVILTILLFIHNVVYIYCIAETLFDLLPPDRNRLAVELRRMASPTMEIIHRSAHGLCFNQIQAYWRIFRLLTSTVLAFLRFGAVPSFLLSVDLLSNAIFLHLVLSFSLFFWSYFSLPLMLFLPPTRLT